MTNRTQLPELEKHYGKVKNYINGEWVESQSREILEVLNPATAQEIGQVPLSAGEEVSQAIAAAQEAFPEWRETPPTSRARCLFRLKELLEEGYEDIARATVQEHGKIIDEARGEARRTIENLEVAAGIPSLMMGYNLEDGAAAGIDEEVIRQPLGVFAAICPFNFPAMVPFWFWPYAVACGNTFVVKPSEQTPITQVKIFELIDEADFPPGVINMVHGAKETVNHILEHPDLRGVSFVGSTPVAKQIYEKAAQGGKRAQCQGGAKNFLVVMPDANLERTVPNLLSSFFGTAGQRCLAGAILIAVGDVYEEVKEKLVEGASRITVGYGLDESIGMGPVISRKSQERVLRYIEKGLEEGAKLLLDGRKVKVEGDLKGFFIGPTIFDDIRPEMAIAQDEIFGPVMGIMRAKDLEQAIEIIHGSPYGNAASIYTQNGAWAREFRYRVQCGNIGINIGIAAPMAFFPFSGYKDSFFGVMHGQGRDAIDFFTERKVVITRWF